MSRPGYVDKRGNNKSRKVRRAWLLLTFDPDLGPERARCRLKLSAWCEQVVDAVTLSVDRLEMGGSYRRGNIQPACKPCQDKQGGLVRVRSMAELLENYRCVRDQWVTRFEETNQSYYPGVIEVERRKERRGGRREVTDWLEDNPPPVFKEWLVEWYAEQAHAQRVAESLADERTG